MRLTLAPMRGVTTEAYRNVFMRHFGGLNDAMAPFIPSVQVTQVPQKLLRDILPEHNTVMPLIPQIIGRNPDDILVMMRAMVELGYEEVNWNLGCPWKHIRKKKRGSGLLAHPDLVEAVFEKVCAEFPGQFSVKVRLGIADNADLEKLAPLLNRYPLKEVTIHARTAEQMYTGEVDLNAFELISSQLTAPVCYNGDINDVAFLKSCQARFPHVEHWMLGRGVLMNPFLCEEIKEMLTFGDKIERLRLFHDDLYRTYQAELCGPSPVLGKMKEFWKYHVAYLSNGHKMFKKLKKATSLLGYEGIVEDWLAKAEWTDTVQWRGDL